MRTSPRASDLELRREQRPGWCIATKAEPAEQIYESTSEDAMIETLSGFPGNVAAFACHGHVTKADYDTVLMPDVSDRLSRHEKLRIYYEVAPEFAGLDPGAVWEDTKVGLSHFLRWERFAVVTDVEWIKHSVKLFGFLMPGELRVFPISDASRAREWIAA